MRYIMIFLLPICFMLLSAYTFYLKLDFCGWMAFGSFLLCCEAISNFPSLYSDKPNENS